MISGSLFTREFLKEGIQEYEEWDHIPDDDLSVFKDKLQKVFAIFPTQGNPIESTTEEDLIKPVLKILGWEHYLTQQTSSKKGRKDVPDILLFSNQELKQKANQEKKQADRYKFGTSILESKAWNLPLDRKRKEAEFGEGVPAHQILRYLSRVDVQSDGLIKWGILTNGRQWRLYYQGAKSRSEEFLELDLAKILELPGFDPDLFEKKEFEGQNWLKVFYILFSKKAFIRTGPNEKSFHERALEKALFWEAQVAQNLSEIVFEEVFPNLAAGLVKYDTSPPKSLNSEYLREVRDSTLTLLYRLLFVLYAEDRRLLPVDDPKYDDYGLQKRVRQDIARRIDHKDTLSETRDDYYRQTCSLFKAIDSGDPSIGLPPYNGGLFDRTKNLLLNRAELPDSVFAPLLDKISRRNEQGNMKWINYRDLSVQQLGSIYEKLLEFELTLDETGQLKIIPNILARKTTGSFYTPESLVGLILEKAIGPLIDEKLNAFYNKIEELRSAKTPKKERLKELKKFDPALSILDLRICDPAMGSSHFLVSLVDYLADSILESMEDAETIVDWADNKNPYNSPLGNRIDSIRKQILDQAKKNGWVVKESQLDDRHIVRRMILKRCIYGVDKNPMAVELTKVSLWLHTFTVGAPLSFLDHHLRCGDSLFGEFAYDVEEFLRQRGSMFIGPEVARARAAAKGMAVIEEITDADISEVHDSAERFKIIDQNTRPLNKFFSFIHSSHWIGDKERKSDLQSVLDGGYGDPVKITSGREKIADEAPDSVKKLIKETTALDREEGFFHWEVAFPGVWDKWESPESSGGFDAVIGNPPWDRIKLQEVEWFASRNPDIAHSARASDRKKLIKKLEKQNAPLWLDYL
ncbi:MAG: restriction endonuclease, partial [Nitrospinae bacterium]|nr:restriction endonuclease [Nitrospinota bacterium]